MASDANIEVKQGYGGSSMHPAFGFTNSPRNFNGTVYYSFVGCEGTRVPVTATINPAASGTGLATGGTTTGASQGASTTQ
ncbi:MAG TPA: hypothetical protein PL084_13035, partial [Chitinophagales bacterium]|nr:hypothetical protein [Chitinophagales bacterium]